MHDHAGGIAADLVEGTTVVRLHGEIDAALRGEASRALATALTSGAPVVLDLGAVTFIDSTGLAFLLQCRRACAQTGQPCSMRHVPERAREVLAMLGVESLVAGAGAGGPGQR